MSLFQSKSASPLLLAWLLAGAPVLAQAVEGDWPTLHRLDGPTLGDRAGWSVAGAGDVDADGFDDVVIGSPHANPGGHIEAGSVFVLSGRDGSLLWQFDGDAVGVLGRLGYAVAGPGDLNGDGFADILATAPWTDPGGVQDKGIAVVYSGLDGSKLFEFIGLGEGSHLGTSASGAGDVNADGVPDLILGSKTFGGGGQVYVHSGLDGALLWVFDGANPADSFGSSVDGAGDVDGDGFADLIVGAVGTDPGGRSQAGSAYVFSGRDGSQLYRFNGEDQVDFLGNSVAGAGDVDGDGLDDFIIGALLADAGAAQSGSAYVRSGADGHLIWRFDGESSGDRLGTSVAGAGDVDGDGVPDLLAGAPDANPAGSAYVFSGRTGVLLHRFDATVLGDDLGFSVASAGDVDGDGRPEVVIGAPSASGHRNGHAFVAAYRGLRAWPPLRGPEPAAPILALVPQQLSASSGLVTAAIAFPDSEAGFHYALLASHSGTGPTSVNGFAVPLTADILFNRMLAGWSPPMFQSAFGTLDAQGDAEALIGAHPSLTRFVGQTVWLAAVSYAAAGPTPRMSSEPTTLALVP